MRAHAVGFLKNYGRGLADRLIAERLDDEDIDVRIAAVRAAARRKSPEAGEVIERLMGDERLHDRDPRELRT